MSLKKKNFVEKIWGRVVLIAFMLKKISSGAELFISFKSLWRLLRANLAFLLENNVSSGNNFELHNEDYLKSHWYKLGIAVDLQYTYTCINAGPRLILIIQNYSSVYEVC